MLFEKQSFVVVGGAKPMGIGLNLVKQLLKIGVEKIAIFDVFDPQDAIHELKDEFPRNAVRFYKVDVRNKVEMEDAFKKVVEIFGNVDVMANIAGIINENRIEDVIRVNLLGAMYGTFIAIDHMSIEDGGRGGLILNVSSVAGLDPIYHTPAYCASKSGMIGFTRSLAAKELEPAFGIKFIVVCPGFTETTLTKSPNELLRNISIEEVVTEFSSKCGMQTAAQCSKSIVDVLKDSENGSVWIINKGERSPVEFPSYFLNIQ